MIVGYRDKRTADFAAGNRVKAFSGIERPARLKLDRKGQYSVRVNDQWASVLSGRMDRLAPRTSRLSIITEEHTMASRAIHPGNHLAEELDALDMSAAELARRLKVPTNRVTAILNGQRAISGDTALRLGHFFGTTPQFWLNLQSLYEIRLAEEKSGKAIKKLPSLKRVEEVHA
jgi:addiction module HigA family antidote